MKWGVCFGRDSRGRNVWLRDDQGRIERFDSSDEAAAKIRPSLAGTCEPRPLRGFASLDRTLISEIGYRGAKSAQAAGTAHRFTSEEAKAAGRKGGQATRTRRSSAEAP